YVATDPHLHAFVCFSFQPAAAPRYLHSFPTRRSSDLPISSVWMPASTSSPRPRAPIMDATTTIDSAIIVVWFTPAMMLGRARGKDRKSTRLNSSHVKISYAVFCLKKKKKHIHSNTVNT